MILYLQVLTISHGNLIWRIFCEVGGLFRINLGKEIEPTDDDKKIKWENRCDEARGLIGMSTSTDLRFHISGIDKPEKAWEKLESMFGKHNEIRGHQLENESLSLNPNDFPCIQFI